MALTARRLVVRGRVQGVGFRYAMVEAAELQGVAGWVRNRRDGTVEAFVQGEDAAVGSVVEWCRRGPPAARVTEVEAVAAEVDGAVAGFTHRATA
jgi:acylphosphatase